MWRVLNLLYERVESCAWVVSCPSKCFMEDGRERDSTSIILQIFGSRIRTLNFTKCLTRVVAKARRNMIETLAMESNECPPREYCVDEPSAVDFWIWLRNMGEGRRFLLCVALFSLHSISACFVYLLCNLPPFLPILPSTAISSRRFS